MTFLPILASIRLGLNTSLIGILLAVQVLGASFLQIPSGRIADRFNRRAMVVLGCSVTFIAMILLPSSDTFWQLLAVCLLFGIGEAGAMPSASAINVEEGKKYGMGMAMALLNMAMGVGMMIGSVLGGVLVDAISINFPFYLAAAAVLIGIGTFSWFTR